MFRCVIHHLQGEHHIKRQKAKVIPLQAQCGPEGV